MGLFQHSEKSIDGIQCEFRTSELRGNYLVDSEKQVTTLYSMSVLCHIAHDAF